MKMRGAKQVHYDSGPNMTPLVDVVMVILIFFMLAGNFGDTDQYLVSNVPIRQKGTPVEVKTVPQDVELKITVDAANDRFVARLAGPENPYTDFESLKDALSGKLQALLDTGKKPEDIQVLISPGMTVKYSFMIEVYSAALSAEADSGGKKVGYTKVAFEGAHG